MISNRTIFIIAGVFSAVVFFIYLGIAWATDKRDLEDARDNIETRERIDDAISNPDQCHWFDRLLNQCE